MKLSVIIVTCNNATTIGDCLKSIFADLSEVRSEVFVVDNASTDDTVGIVKRFPQVKLIQNQQNLGFAAANNQALKKAKGEFILLLNPDTQVRSGAISKMIDFMEKHPKVGILGPTVKIVNGKEQLTGGWWVQPLLARAGYSKFEKLPQEPREVDYVTGAALLIRRKVVKKIGPLPEDYFLYYEDADWCLRAKEAGYQVVYYPAAEVIHREGSSFGKKSFKQTYYGVKAGLILGLRWTPPHLKPLYFVVVAAKFLKRLLINGPRSPQFLGSVDFLLGRWGRSDFAEKLG